MPPKKNDKLYAVCALHVHINNNVTIKQEYHSVIAGVEVVFFLTSAGVRGEYSGNDYLEKAKEVMSLVITKKIFMRPKDEVGIVLGGCANTDDGPEFFQENVVPSWEMVEKVSSLRQSDARFVDWHTALTYTLACMGDLQAGRIVLILLFNCDDEYRPPAYVSAQEFADTIISLQINVLWIGSKDLNNAPTESLNASERIMMKILESAAGECKNIDAVLPQLRFFVKPKSTYMAWKARLELGNIFIPTTMYVSATDDVKKPPFKNVTAKLKADENAAHRQRPPEAENVDEGRGRLDVPENGNALQRQRPPEAGDVAEGRGRPDNPENFVLVKNERDYVDRNKDSQPVWDTIPGYMYGRHFVPLPEADERGMKYDGGPKSLKIFGFVPRESIRLEDLSGDTTRIVIPQGEGSARPFYCLARAMANRKRVAIARRIYAATRDPKMGVLIPRLDVPGQPSCMLFIELLFAEDRRVIQSQSLNSTTKNLSKEKEDIVENMIDAMMLTEHNDAIDNEPFASGTVRSPNLQHHWNSLSYRALNPGGPAPPMSEYLTKLIEPPESIKLAQEPLLKRLRELFPIEDELALSKKASETSAEVAVPVLSEVEKMECDLAKIKSDIEEVENGTAEKGLKRKRSMEETTLPTEESYVDPDLDDLFDQDMSF